MENKSILDQILTNLSEEEVAKLNALDIISNLFSELSDREKDVLSKRFGLHGSEKITLENIGKIHNLTRERIRQIEVMAIKKLKQLKTLENYIAGLKKVINSLIEEHGGLIEKEYLLNNLVNFSVDGGRSNEEEKKVHMNHFHFLISKILHEEFEEIIGHNDFKESFKFKFKDIDHIENFIKELTDKISRENNIKTSAEIFELAKQLDSYKKYNELSETPNTLDISASLKNDFFAEDTDLINNHKPIFSVLKASKHIAQNKFGQWGLKSWGQVKPRTINDKIFLVLKDKGKPMHFVEISDRINEINFDKKKANPATVHNELILDDKYILVGRGLYGLKEWGYDKGTVADIIVKILTDSKEPLTKEQIIAKVLGQRMVKKATIVLALMNKNKFEKIDGQKYKLKI